MTWRPNALVILAWILGQGCSSVPSTDLLTVSHAGGACNTCRAGAQGKNDYEISIESSAAGSAGKTSGAEALALCAVQNPSCDPDDASSCSNAAPTLSQGGVAAEGGVNAAGSYVLLPSDVSRSVAGAASIAMGGANAALAGRSTTLAGSSGAAGTQHPVAMACRVQRDNVVARTTCEPAGSGELGSPCISRANCVAGLACVEENGTAQCRPYCCHGVQSCPSGTYCDQRTTKELVTTNERLTVSVCMPGVACSFADPYPCPPDRTCSCPTGKACSLVRADGTTACVPPGTGHEGESCPCAAGHVCSDPLGTCFKICSLANNASGCASGVCQASASMPSGWGLCVSASSLL